METDPVGEEVDLLGERAEQDVGLGDPLCATAVSVTRQPPGLVPGVVQRQYDCLVHTVLQQGRGSISSARAEAVPQSQYTPC